MVSHPGGEEPATGRGHPAGETALLGVLLRLSRAHWLLSSVLSWLPAHVRRHAEEAADLLDGAITDLRRYAARGEATASDPERDEPGCPKP